MKRVWIVVVVVLVVFGIGGLVVLSQIAKRTRGVATVRSAEVTRASLVAVVSAPGRVDAVEAVNVSAEVPGRVVELNVEEGDRIEKGQVVLRLDDARYRSAVEQAQATLRTAQANLDLTMARLDKAKADLDRVEGLAQGDLASDEQLQAARTDHRVVSAEAEARRQDVSRARAAVEGAKDDLEKTVYRSPLDGVVTRLNVKRGENVVIGTMNNPGTVILTIADLSVMEVEADVDETDVVNVAEGQPAKITVDAIPDTSFAASVVAVGNSGRSRTRSTSEEAVDFQVTVRFTDADSRLRPGMTADVDIETERRENVLTVPIQALVARSRSILERDLKAAKEDPARYAPPDSLTGEARDRFTREIVEGVYAIRDGRARFVEVKSGIADASRIEIEPVGGDLEPGSKIVGGPYKALRDLKEGARLRVREGRGDGEDS